MQELVLRTPQLMADSQGASRRRVASSCLGDELGCSLGIGVGELVLSLWKGSGKVNDSALSRSWLGDRCCCCPTGGSSSKACC